MDRRKTFSASSPAQTDRREKRSCKHWETLLTFSSISEQHRDIQHSDVCDSNSISIHFKSKNSRISLVSAQILWNKCQVPKKKIYRGFFYLIWNFQVSKFSISVKFIVVIVTFWWLYIDKKLMKQKNVVKRMEEKIRRRRRRRQWDFVMIEHDDGDDEEGKERARASQASSSSPKVEWNTSSTLESNFFSSGRMWDED